MKVQTVGFWRLSILILAVSLTMNMTAYEAGGTENEGHECGAVRPSVLAGTWYDADPQKLGATVDRYLAEAGEPLPGADVVGLVAPHAGYVYSGRCAAHAYRTVVGRSVRRVILLGPSHTTRFRGLALPESAFFETPLGRVEVDQAACRFLEGQTLFGRREGPHEQEHSLEIQLPFLQRTLEPGFTVLPLVVGELDRADYDRAADTLRQLCDDRTLVVVSTDFTHYGASFGYQPFTGEVQTRLAELDGGAVEEILQLDLDGFLGYHRKTGITVCGYRSLAIMISLFGRGWDRGEITVDNLHYTTSGEATGDWSHVVSYQAMAIRCDLPAKKEEIAPADEEVETAAVAADDGDNRPAAELSPAEQNLLLGLARETLRLHVIEGRRPPAERAAALPPIFSEPRGAFVTLHKRGRLRGCIGYIQARKPLWETVVENTVNAASSDPRFPPVGADELPQLHIEVSVLSPLAKLPGPEAVEVGRHGLYIVKGFYSGLLLPQVPVEQGWDRTAFLENLCLKAGLERDAYLRGAELYGFTAQVFGEPTEPGDHAGH